MSDIIERLLNRAANAVIIKDKPNLYYDAAHEIERLRAENEKLRDAYDTDALTISYNLGYTCGKDIAKDEIEKLRKALLYVYDNSLGLDPDKITDDVEWVTAEIRAAAAAIRGKE
jgi:hypothetical protein